jgi:AraC family transcriptional regulator of adaptative response / DNA-3-methyladenine glycosylase II
MTRRDVPAYADARSTDALSTVARLSTGTPFDGAGLMRFFADHAVPGLESGGAGRYARAVRLPHGNGAVEIALGGPDDGDPDDGTQDDGTPAGQAMLLCTARVDNALDLDVLLARVRRLFDLDADSEAIDAALGRDPGLSAAVAAQPGIRLPGSLDAEETLFRTLIGQQISVKAARTVLGRVTAELGEGDAAAGTRLFPTAETLAEHGREVLRGPASRIAAIVGVAEALASGALRTDATMPVEELTASLVALPGVGPWTAGYLAMRVLGNPDVLLTTDLVMLQSATRLGLPATARGLAEHGRRWAPWRSYAGLHLWRAAR